MSFKSQKEIWEHLISGGKIITCDQFIASLNSDGFFAFDDGSLSSENFEMPHRWQIYEEPKPKRKVILYRHLLQSSKNTYLSQWSDYIDQYYIDIGLKVLMTESKEIEIDT